MYIQHNMVSLNARNHLNTNARGKAKSAEKLSSGYRINRAADDAAGLSISEKMRWQIRGLDQGSENIQDGISVCQVADGGLVETQAILHKITELSIQAANDTNTAADRWAIQQEINSLLEEINHIADTTTYNNKLYPLKGGGTGTVSSVTLSGALNKDVIIEEYTSPIYFASFRGKMTPFRSDGETYQVGDKTNVTGLRLSGRNSLEIDGVGPGAFGENTMWTEDLRIGQLVDADGNMLTASMNNYHKLTYNSLRLSDLKLDDNGYVYYDLKPDSSCLDSGVGWHMEGTPPGWTGKMYLTIATSPIGTYLGPETYYPSSGSVFSNGYIYKEPNEDGYYIGNDGKTKYEFLKGSLTVSTTTQGGVDGGDGQVWIQMSSEQGDGMFLSIVDATTGGLKLDEPPIDVSSYESASSALERIADAVDVVSGYRSMFGAQQNRLEHGKAVVDNTAGNVQYAESRIRDTDMAEEIMWNSKVNILEQAGQALLAQANQLPQGVLELLQ